MRQISAILLAFTCASLIFPSMSEDPSSSSPESESGEKSDDDNKLEMELESNITVVKLDRGLKFEAHSTFDAAKSNSSTNLKDEEPSASSKSIKKRSISKTRSSSDDNSSSSSSSESEEKGGSDKSNQLLTAKNQTEIDGSDGAQENI